MSISTFRLLVAPLWIIIITCTSYTYISILQSELLSNADQQESLVYTFEKNDEQKISPNIGINAEARVYTDEQPLQLHNEETETKGTQEDDMSDVDISVTEKNIPDYEVDNITMSIQICDSDKIHKNMTNLDPISMLEATYASTKSLTAIFKMLKNLTSDRPHEYHGQHITSDMEPIEIARCKRYGYEYNSTLQNKRKRVFLGALVGDDSWHSIGAHAMEMYGLYHTVALVEGNKTFTKHDRCKRFQPGSIHHEVLKKSGILGPNTTVKTALYYARESDIMDAIDTEQLQRDVFTKIWIQQGMTDNDIGVVADMDEFFTRDFMLAIQTCQVPEFQKGQSCKAPKIVAKTLIFEAAPDCIYKTKRWYHPDAIIGECIDGIGNETLHKPTLRKSFSGMRETFREDGFGKMLKDYDNKSKQDLIRFPPLWKPVDFRSAQGAGRLIGEIFKGDNPKRPTGHVAYHFHNFFDSIKPIRKNMLHMDTQMKTRHFCH